MNEEPDIGSAAWEVWRAVVNGEGLPLTLTLDDLLQLTDMEVATLERIALRKGRTITYDPINMTMVLS